MPGGTDLARTVERRLAGGLGPDDEVSLTAEARELRRIVETGPGGGRAEARPPANVRSRCAP
jgi:hypothetical protein